MHINALNAQFQEKQDRPDDLRITGPSTTALATCLSFFPQMLHLRTLVMDIKQHRRDTKISSPLLLITALNLPLPADHMLVFNHG